jgi:predicted Zn finger-like uncharacterized protein
MTSAAPETVTCNLCAAAFAIADAVLLVKDAHEIVRCPRCRLVFRARLPDPSDLAALYGADYFAAASGEIAHEGYLDYVADADVHRVNARRRLRLLARLTSPGRLLDVGCAAGFFVEEATRAGWAARGLDISAPMVAWGQRTLGVEISVGTLSEPSDDPLVSCITMWDYIEHAIDPSGDLERARSRLRPGGLLALSTGDVGSLLARLSLDRWHLMTPRHHNYFFSAATLQHLLRDRGYDVVGVSHPGAVFPLRYLAHKACMAVDVRPATAAASFLARSRLGLLQVPLNLWDVMTVIARRPLAASG